MTPDQLKKTIGAIPDYPKPGITFRDITPLLQDREAFAAAIDLFAERYRDSGITQIAAIEARGFIFGAALAKQIGCGVTLLRKPGKLPGATVSQSYQLEYGEDSLEMRADSLNSNDNVLIVDDLLATGGTAEAAAILIKKAKAVIVEAAFLVSLNDLPGEQKLQQQGVACYTLCRF
ncbi:adenine phosphoribosyltransferase [Idiomarina seosinensis]|uniref:Adenine phosphoribosyltransferase n=1 Tax=Idiomarina seosinensis TaxID=281739 RepID=A0A432ZJJ1_9GAMM|nr:adenine phosphoribosyltransferase [Idiomarina seosinensis]RUO78054.1 adenine phosphoribosyltransferase [Idiomarina seosinensis]